MFSRFLKFIISFFSRITKNNNYGDEKKITPVIESKKFLCSLNFELGFNGQINITCYWPDLDNLNEPAIKLIAEQYAQMIYLIDNGFTKKDIIDTLYEVHTSNNPYDIFFVQEVLDNWVGYYNKLQSKNSKPLIKPSNVFKQYK
jgi:hypothetical protein